MSDLVPPTPAPPSPAPPPSTLKGIKETVESIVIAFILAFVFRAFIVEAFVIPTGSMATTLLGAHMRFTCQECGYRFVVNYSSSQSGEDIDIPSRAGERDAMGRALDAYGGRAVDAWCPNCRFKVPEKEATRPLVHYGDRILVLKSIYLASEARRWDVVVFKNPTHLPKEGQHYSQNYIKRLVGLPGETLMILDGDIYVHERGKWKIQAKPAHVQEAMWRLVYDHDYRPMNNQRKNWRLPWVTNGGSGWDLSADNPTIRTFSFDRSAGFGAIEFDDSQGQHYFTDWLAYNPNDPGSHRDYPVSDLKLAFTYERHAGDGPLCALLSKRDVEYAVVMNRDQLDVYKLEDRPGAMVRALMPGGLQQYYRKRTPLLPRSYPLNPLRAARVEMMNVDHEFTLRINGEVICRASHEPNVEQMKELYEDGKLFSSQPKPRVMIAAANQKATVSHVSLWRDVFYTPGGYQRIQQGGPTNPIELDGTRGQREYFVLGDNSEQSQDARFWTDEIDIPQEVLKVAQGRVPERFMLGKAFFVYWPAGYKPLTDEAPSLVPNFGQMRLIH